VSRATAIRSLAGAAALLALATFAGAQPARLPEPPIGFHWERAPEIKGAFLVPHNWFFKAEKHQDTLGYFVTRENIDKTGESLVGLTVNVMPHLKSRDAVEAAKALMAGFTDGKKVLDFEEAKMRSLVGGSCLAQDETTTTHTLALANPKTNTVYLILFEAPTSQWEKEWPAGEEILGAMLLDDDV
jgi:hypothetical protein